MCVLEFSSFIKINNSLDLILIFFTILIILYVSNVPNLFYPTNKWINFVLLKNFVT